MEQNMPMYRFVCPDEKCSFEEKKLMTREEAEKFSGACRMCGIPYVQTLGDPNTRSMETADEYRGRSVVQDINEKVHERAKKHFKEHELSRMIDEHGIEHARRMGWIDAEGRPK